MSIDPSSQTVQQTPESGLRFDRVWWKREQQAGQIGDDPDWQLYSDLLLEFSAELDPGLERVDGLGDPDPDHFSRTLEENEVMVAYALQQPLLDNNDQPYDAAADAYLRDNANQIPNTHAMVARDENLTPGPDDPAGTLGQRQYLVMKGGKADAESEPDSEEAQPVPMALTYTPEKVRTYHVYQPENSTLIAVYSDSAEDTTQQITIEDEGAGQTETINLDGTNLVSGSVEFTDIDAFELSDDTEGDVHIVINEGTETDPTEGAELTSIHGGQYYSSDDNGDVEGDLGVPALGAGSAPSEIGEPYEDFFGDRVERPVGARIAPDLNNIVVSVENNLETRPRHDSTRVRVNEGNREVTIETDVVGEKQSHEMIQQAFGNEGLDMEWELAYTLFRFPNATVTDPPARERAPDDVFAETAGTYQSEGVELEYTGGFTF